MSAIDYVMPWLEDAIYQAAFSEKRMGDDFAL
jgi:hypothetical protein